MAHLFQRGSHCSIDSVLLCQVILRQRGQKVRVAERRCVVSGPIHMQMMGNFGFRQAAGFEKRNVKVQARNIKKDKSVIKVI